MEIWKDINVFEGYYQVSNLGNIKSLSRTIKSSVGTRKTKERILKGKLVKSGRLYVDLYSEDKKIQEQVSVLVAIHFLNHTKCGYKIIVDHIDNNPLNNRVDNLQLTSQRNNVVKDKKEGFSKYIGVSFDKSRNKWESRICVSGKPTFLGRFATELEASQAYQCKLSSLNQNGID